jgi:phosphoadenosine phosphosulfate reductase
MKALAFSGGKDSMACLHLLRDELDCAIYVDTGFSYPETRALVNYAAGLIPLHIVQTDRAGQNAMTGIPSDVVPIDWTFVGQSVTAPKPALIQSYLQCCFENIAKPLFDKAKVLGVTELFYGERAEEAHHSTSHDGDVLDGIIRRHPIENWTEREVFELLERHMTVPDHYYAVKHSSLDCYDCTAYTRESQDRIAWMHSRYPAHYRAYQVRREAIDHAILEAVSHG